MGSSPERPGRQGPVVNELGSPKPLLLALAAYNNDPFALFLRYSAYTHVPVRE